MLIGIATAGELYDIDCVTLLAIGTIWPVVMLIVSSLVPLPYRQVILTPPEIPRVEKLAFEYVTEFEIPEKVFPVTAEVGNRIAGLAAKFIKNGKLIVPLADVVAVELVPNRISVPPSRLQLTG